MFFVDAIFSNARKTTKIMDVWISSKNYRSEIPIFKLSLFFQNLKISMIGMFAEIGMFASVSVIGSCLLKDTKSS